MAPSQDIEGASALLFDRLTLQEKTLAKELVSFSNYDKPTRVGRYRAPVLRLDAVVASLAASSKGDADPPKNLLIYCDVLICNDTVAVGGPKPLTISIFARKITQVRSTSSTDVIPAIRFQAAKTSNITVWAQEIPSPFKVDFVSDSGKTESKEMAIPAGSPGFNAFFDGATVTVKPRPLPNVELNYENWVNLIKEDGTLGETPFLKDNMPRLLQFQFLVAASQMYENPEFALQLLNWICLATSTQAGSLINAQAQSLRNSLSINATAPVEGDKTEILPVLSLTNVPSVNVYSCKQIMKARLQAAWAFEQSFQNFVAQERNAVDWSLLGNDLIIKSDNALQEYKFLRKVAGIRFDEALQAHKGAETRFKATKTRVDEAAITFQKNVEAWKSEMKDAATWEILKGVVEIGVAVAATVATFGAAAPAVAAVGAQVVSKASQVIALWEKVKTVIKELKAIYEKLKPTIKALGELFQKVNAMADVIKGLNPVVPSQDMKQADMSLDALNALAQWRLFDVQVELLKESLAGCDIKDKDQYYLALKALVIDGQTFLQAQTSLVTRGDELAIVSLRLNKEESARPSLENMTRHFRNDTAVVQLLKIAMFDRLLAVRSMVFVDFHGYASAYMFHSLESYVPVTLSPVKPIVDYLNDAATLQSAVVGFGSTVLVQKKTFSIPFSAEKAKELLGKLAGGEKRFELQVSPDDEQFEGVCRVRVSQARFSFVGAKPSTSGKSKPLRLALSTGRQFYDIGFPAAIPTSTLIRGYRGDKRRVIFEQDLETNQIQCDGDFGLKQDYLMLTPFTTWTVEVAAGSLPAEAISDAAISGATLDLTCEVCFLP